MQYAKNEAKEKVRATPEVAKEKHTCPCCDSPVVAKCGDIKVWHWSHTSLVDCDSWGEGETEWHLNWKSYAKPEETEVVIPPHRADMRNANGLVIEFQHSALSPQQIEERETFYDRMIWVFDVSDAVEKGNIKMQRILEAHDNHWQITWSYAKTTWLTAKKYKFLDFGDGSMFLIRAVWGGSPKTLDGWPLSKQTFIDRYITLVRPPKDYDSASIEIERQKKVLANLRRRGAGNPYYNHETEDERIERIRRDHAHTMKYGLDYSTRYDCPKHVLTPELREELRRNHKPGIYV